MLIGYMRISKSDGSQNLNLQKDALIAADVQEERIYQDMVSGKRESRPGIDTTTSNGWLVFGLFASLAEYERELIIERTHAGLKAARARGRLGGRPRKMDIHTLKMAMAAMSDPKSVASDVAKRLNIALYLC